MQRGRGRELETILPHPRSSPEAARCITNYLAVTDHRLAYFDIPQRHFVRLRYGFGHTEAVCHLHATRETFRFDHNGDVISVVDLDPRSHSKLSFFFNISHSILGYEPSGLQGRTPAWS